MVEDEEIWSYLANKIWQSRSNAELTSWHGQAIAAYYAGKISRIEYELIYTYYAAKWNIYEGQNVEHLGFQVVYGDLYGGGGGQDSGGQFVHFASQLSSLYGKPVSIQWDFGDGQIWGEGIDPVMRESATHWYERPGTYTVTLTTSKGPVSQNVIIPSPVPEVPRPMVDAAEQVNGVWQLVKISPIPGQRLYGDVEDRPKYGASITSVMLIAQYDVGNVTFSAEQIQAGDVLGEGKPNIVSAQVINTWLISPWIIISRANAGDPKSIYFVSHINRPVETVSEPPPDEPPPDEPKSEPENNLWKWLAGGAAALAFIGIVVKKKWRKEK